MTAMFEHRHPVDGALRIVRHGDAVRVDCRWPFDLHTGEWIYIVTDISVSALGECVESLRNGQPRRADGVRGGFIEFAPDQESGSTIEVADQFGSAPTRLQLNLSDRPEDLAERLASVVA